MFKQNAFDWMGNTESSSELEDKKKKRKRSPGNWNKSKSFDSDRVILTKWTLKSEQLLFPTKTPLYRIDPVVRLLIFFNSFQFFSILFLLTWIITKIIKIILYHRIKIGSCEQAHFINSLWSGIKNIFYCFHFFFFDKPSKIGYSENAAWFFYNRDSCRWMSFRRGFSSTNEQNFCWRVTWTILSCQSNQSFRK